jgi:Lipocalin-like domain
MNRILLSLLTLIVAAFPIASSAQQLVGTYKLLSFNADYDDGASKEVFGKLPSGYLILTPKRLMVILVSEGRMPGSTPDQKAALLSSMFSYTGTYQVDGSRLVTDVDVSWNQAWTGSKQGRTWLIEGNRLVLTTDKAPSVLEPSKMTVGRLVWEKVE